MQEPGTARGGDGESRHTGRGLHGVGAQRAADPVFTLPRGCTCCRIEASVTIRSPETSRPSVHFATISYVPGCALGGTLNCPIASPSCALGASVNVPAPTAVASPAAVPSSPHAAVFTVTSPPGTAFDGNTSRLPVSPP